MLSPCSTNTTVFSTGGAVIGEFDGQVTGGDAVAHAERRLPLQAFAVQQRAVLAAQILDEPSAFVA